MHTNLFRNQGENYPPPDFLSQIEAVLNNYGAQYGHNTGAISEPRLRQGEVLRHPLASVPAGCASALGTGLYVANASIPNVCLNPVIQNLDAKYIPASNGRSKTLFQNYQTPLNNNVGESRHHAIDGRNIVLDTVTNSHTTSTNAIPNYEILNQSARTQTFSVNDTWIINPNTLNVLRLGFNRFLSYSLPTDPTSLNSLGSAFPIIGKPVLRAVTVNSRMVLSSNSTDERHLYQ